MITGEQRLYNASTAAFDGPAVAHPFSLSDGGWGAWELAARYSDADLNFNAGAPRHGARRRRHPRRRRAELVGRA